MPGQNQPRFCPNRNAVNVLKNGRGTQTIRHGSGGCSQLFALVCKIIEKNCKFFLNCFQTKFVASILALLVFLCFFSGLIFCVNDQTL